MEARMPKIQILITMLAIVTIGTVDISAAFNQEDIMMHGFVSQGYLNSSENNLFGNSEDGSYEFNEIAINFAVPITDDLRFGIQLFSRDLGTYGNNDLTVDWAFLTYEWQRWLKFRAGKVKIPYGLHGGKRDGDMLRTSILMPQGVYPDALRDFVVAFHGAEIYGNCELGAMGNLDYEIYTGTLDIPSDSPFLEDAFVVSGLKKGIDYNTMKDMFDTMDLKITILHFEGGKLVWNLPINGLRLGITYSTGKGEIDLGSQSAPAKSSYDAVRIVSADYENGPIHLIAEHFFFDSEMEMSGTDPSQSKMEGWYGSFAYRIKDWLELGLYYSEYYKLPDDKDGDIFVEAGYQDYYAWQKDSALSIRFDITDHWAVKLEGHTLNGVGLCNISENLDGMDENWNLYALKTSLSF